MKQQQGTEINYKCLGEINQQFKVISEFTKRPF